MDFQVGDRVKSLIDDIPGLYYGEFGRIVKLRECNTPVIEWDEYIPERHSCDGMVAEGHGWYVYDNSQIELVCQFKDYGNIERSDVDMTKFLFDA